MACTQCGGDDHNAATCTKDLYKCHCGRKFNDEAAYKQHKRDAHKEL